jgi:hypothetical protein
MKRRPRRSSASGSAGASPPRWWPRRLPAAWPAAGTIALFLLARFSFSFRSPFMADDFLFLEKTRSASFLTLWEPRDLAFRYYRPWSRELHYWWLQHAFGARELPFHIASFALCTAFLTLYFAFVRRLAGTVTAIIATAAAAVLSAWPILLIWIAGSQDLWMLVFAMASLVSLSHGRHRWAAALYAGALLSKETAAVLPLIALSYVGIFERRRLLQAVRATAGFWLITAAWIVLHPLLGGRLWWSLRAEPVPGIHASLASIAARTILSVVNLDAWPRPEGGWLAALARSGGALVVLAIGLGLALHHFRRRRGGEPVEAAGTRPILLFATAWMLIGWAPLLVPSIGWHAYYGLLGTLGAWTILATMLSRWPRVAFAGVVALGMVDAGRTTTFSLDWGSAFYQMRAARFVSETRTYFRTRHPEMPPHSRVYLGHVPGSVGLVPGGEESPVLQFWYGDTTLRTYYMSRYRPRARDEHAGADFYFTYDSSRGWSDEEALALGEDPTTEDRIKYATQMWNVRRFDEAAKQYQVLVGQSPNRYDYLFSLGSCYYQQGDTVTAARYYQRAVQFPGAPEGMKRAARRLARFLRE